MVVFNLIIFVSGLFIYFIAKYLQSRRGVDVDLSYKELPSE
jgi:heme/copper-type cytochrome/quinol oxidase subunit 2